MTRQSRMLSLAHTELIETEIRHYHDTVQALTNAIQTLTSAQLLELYRRIEAIECMLWILRAHPEQKRYELVKLTYWTNGRYTVDQICQKLNISRSTYHKWKQEALQIVGERLGWRI